MSRFRKNYSQPSRSDVHVNRPLTNISIAFVQKDDSFIAAKVFPLVPVSKQSDAYFTFDRGEFNRDEMSERLPGTESAGGSYTLSTDTYYAKVRAFHKDIPAQVRANADDPLDMDREATLYVTQKGLINRELNWVAAYFTGGQAPGATWTFVADGVDSSPTAASSFDPTNASNNDVLRWNDANSNPIEDVRRGKRYVLERTGIEPNTLTLGKVTYDTLLDHPDIVGRIDRGQTSGAARANLVTLADLFEVDNVYVSKAIQNTAVKGQSAAHSFIAGKHALLSYAPPTPGIMTPSAGYTYSWTGLLGAGADGINISKWWEQKIKSDRVEIEMAYDQKKVSADLGYFFNGIVA